MIKSKARTILYGIIIFLLIYRPFQIIKINQNIFPIAVFLVFAIIDILSGSKYMFSKLMNKSNCIFLLGILFSLLHCALRVALNDDVEFDFSKLRVMQHLFIIMLFMISIFIVNRLKSLEYTSNNLIELVLIVGMIQGLICLVMVFVPSFRKIAVSAYVATTRFNEGDYILTTRVYGLTDSYTYGLPIVNGLLSGLCFYHSIYNNKKFFFALPFILIASILNGRTGILIAIISIAITIVFVNSKNKIKALKFGILIFIIFVALLNIIKSTNANMYRFISDLFSVFSDSKNNSTVGYLTGQGWFFPAGIYFIFGMGTRVYGGLGSNIVGKNSDIGYVNYMFLGGIIYTIVFISSFIFLYIRSVKNAKEALIIKAILVISSLISCWKGEIFNNLNYVFTTFIISMTYMYLNTTNMKEERLNDRVIDNNTNIQL